MTARESGSAAAAELTCQANKPHCAQRSTGASPELPCTRNLPPRLKFTGALPASLECPSR
eukprot:3454532-Pyramimonas_sp.AAC.1